MMEAYPALNSGAAHVCAPTAPVQSWNVAGSVNLPTHPISLSHVLYGALHAFPHMLQLLVELMLRHEPVGEQRANPVLHSDAMCVLFSPNKKNC